MKKTMRQRLTWSSLGSTCSILAVCAFVLASTWARLSPIQAGEDKAVQATKGKKADPATKKKGGDSTKVQQPLRPIPATGTKVNSAALAKIIDQEVQLRLQSEGIKPSPLADDAEFLRRVYLDIVGVIPTSDKVQAFLDSKESNKRSKVIDELLADPRFGNSLAETWSGQMLPRESNNRALNHTPLQKWLAKHFNDNKPLDKLVYELITSTGSQEENGAVTYFIGNPTVDKMTDNVSRMFLGVQLQCAQCHNHPFTDWKQTEYWGMAAFFMKTRLTANPQQAAKKGVSPGIFEGGAAKGGKKGNLPESAKFVPAKFLQAEQPKMDPTGPARPTLATWATSPSNPFFARAMVNRIWYQMFGRGLVHPVDDMHKDNPATHPELLAALTEQFKSNDFDLKYLIRALCNSQAYQRSSKPQGDNATDTELLSRRVVRVLTAEQLYDSLVTVVGTGAGKREIPVNKAVGKKGPGGPREQFLAFFRIDEGADPLEYQAGIPQALRLMNSPLLNNAGTVAKAMQDGKTPDKVIERLYLTAVSRMPNDQELQRMIRHVQSASDPRTGYGDVLWALLNSSEFALNH